MVKHIVLFKFKRKSSGRRKKMHHEPFQGSHRGASCPDILYPPHLCGLNLNPDEKWDICLESEFDSLDDVKAYAVHPAHVAAAGIIKEVKADRACTDYEC